MNKANKANINRLISILLIICLISSNVFASSIQSFAGNKTLNSLEITRLVSEAFSSYSSKEAAITYIQSTYPTLVIFDVNELNNATLRNDLKNQGVPDHFLALFNGETISMISSTLNIDDISACDHSECNHVQSDATLELNDNTLVFYDTRSGMGIIWTLIYFFCQYCVTSHSYWGSFTITGISVYDQWVVSFLFTIVGGVFCEIMGTSSNYSGSVVVTAPSCNYCGTNKYTMWGYSGWYCSRCNQGK